MRNRGIRMAEKRKYIYNPTTIDSIEKIDVSALTFTDICKQYGTGRAYAVMSRGEKQSRYRNGVATNIGNILESVWCEIVRQMIRLHGEEELFGQLYEWYRADDIPGRTKAETEKEVFALHTARIFDDPAWVDYLPFNRKYRPEVLAEAEVVTVMTDCCRKEGSITREVYENRYNNTVPCPHCGRYSTFCIAERKEELQ